jgi:tubulin-folding cofactor B
VRFDEPVGKSDGSVKGTRVFDCQPNFGAFVRGKNVTVDDFPERDLMDSDCEGSGEQECSCDDEDEI